MGSVRVAILGTGRVVRTFHLPALVANPRAQVVALGNLRAASLDELARRFGIKETYTDFEQIADDSRIDAVVNALPNYLHAPVSTMMLQAGKHVLCEKPMATTSVQARVMCEAAEAAGRTLMVAHVWRLHAAVRWLRDVVQAGTLGKIYKACAHCVVTQSGPSPDGWFVRPELAGGGALADVGIHGIDTISFLFGDALGPVVVTAQVGNRVEQLAVEYWADVRIEFDRGCIAQIEAGWYGRGTRAPHGTVELFGSKGYACSLPPKLEVGGKTYVPTIRSEHPDVDASVYAAQMDHFLDCVLTGVSPTCTARQGLWDVSVVEAAYQAARNGPVVAGQPSTARSAAVSAEIPTP